MEDNTKIKENEELNVIPEEETEQTVDAGENTTLPDSEEPASEADKNDDGEEENEKNEDGEEEEKELSGEEKTKKLLKEVGSTLLTIVIAVIVALFLNIYVIRISNINGNSMQPTYANGQTVVLSRLPYIFSEPKYNDIVVFDSENTAPGERTFINDLKDTVEYNAITMYVTKTATAAHKFWIKRVVGLPGDVIEIKDRQLYRNGELLVEDYINEQNWAGADQKWVISEDCVFVMGDNRNHSSDSRYIGEVSYDAILGKVLTEGKEKDD